MKKARINKLVKKATKTIYKKPALKKDPVDIKACVIKKKPAAKTIYKKPSVGNPEHKMNPQVYINRPMTEDEYCFYLQTRCDPRQFENGSTFHQFTIGGPSPGP